MAYRAVWLAMSVSATLTACGTVQPAWQGAHMQGDVLVEGVGMVPSHKALVDQLRPMDGFKLVRYRSSIDHIADYQLPKGQLPWEVATEWVYQGDREIDFKDVNAWFNPQIQQLGWGHDTGSGQPVINGRRGLARVDAPNGSDVARNQYQVAIANNVASEDEAAKEVVPF